MTMRKLLLTAALIAPPALATAAMPAFACHRFSLWNYPWPQRCAVVSPASFHPAKLDHSWIVEITSAPPLPQPEAGDQRTPEEIEDFDEHYIQLEKHKDEINKLMIILHAEEDARRAAGLQ